MDLKILIRVAGFMEVTVATTGLQTFFLLEAIERSVNGDACEMVLFVMK